VRARPTGLASLIRFSSSCFLLDVDVPISLWFSDDIQAGGWYLANLKRLAWWFSFLVERFY
jgi:hypothetical protein